MQILIEYNNNLLLLVKFFYKIYKIKIVIIYFKFKKFEL